MTEKLRMMVACHKKAEVFQNEVYKPIHVGKALHPDLDLGFPGDDTGDNISKLNPYYCELTAEYWAWKNTDCEYIGLQHYRRYFDFEFTYENIDEVMSDYDVVLAKPMYLDQTIFEFWMKSLVPEDLIIAIKVLESLYPEDYQKGVSFLDNKVFYPCNMFVCKKKLFDEFAEWQFNLLETVRKQIRLSSYSREQRILGFLSEGLLPMYFLNRKCRIKTMPVISFPGNHNRILQREGRAKLKALLFKHTHHCSLDFPDPILVGLRQDGYLDDHNHFIIK